MTQCAASQPDDRLLTEQLRELAQRGRIAALVAMTAILMIGWAHWGGVPEVRVFAWLGYLCAIQLVRVVLVDTMVPGGPGGLSARQCRLAQIVVNVFNGLGWGAMWFLLDSGRVDFLFMFKFGAIAGASGIAVNSLCVVFPAYVGFLVPQMGLTVVYLLVDTPYFSPDQRLAFVIGVVVYAFVLTAIARNAAKLARRAFVQGFEREQALAEATRSHQREQELRKNLEEQSRQIEDANQKLNAINERLQVLARQDALTGVFNRRHLVEELERNLLTYQRYGGVFSLIILDIDHFKQINDNHSHQTGDLVLKAATRKMLAGLREIDVFGRWGGEEFLCVLPNTEFDEAMICAERLCSGLAAAPLLATLPGLHVTASFGVVACARDDDIDTLVSRADTALYQAKAAGRNRVIGARR